MRLNAGGALGGAATGALYGSSFGAPGAIAGGLIGGVAGLFGGNKRKRKPRKLSRFDETQQGIYGDYAKGLQGQGQFANLYNFDANAANNVFDLNVANPEYRNFNENIVPGITGNFRGRNLQNSSYLGQSLSKAGRDVQERLSGLRAAQMYAGQEAANQRKLSGLENILNMQTFDYEQPEAQQPGMLDQLMGSLAQGAGGYLRDYLGQKTPPVPGASSPTSWQQGAASAFGPAAR